MCKKTSGYNTILCCLQLPSFLYGGGGGRGNILFFFSWGAAANEFQFFSILQFFLKNINLNKK